MNSPSESEEMTPIWQRELCENRVILYDFNYRWPDRLTGGVEQVVLRLSGAITTSGFAKAQILVRGIYQAV